MSTENGKEKALVPSSAKEWRKARIEGYTIPLPSGKIVTLKPVALDQLVRSGKLPDLLSPVAARSLWAETESHQIANDPELNKQFLELIDIIVPLAMMVPAVVESPDPKKEEIQLDDMDFLDKVAVFNLATQPAEMLKSFRDQQARRLSFIPDGKDDVNQAERSD